MTSTAAWKNPSRDAKARLKARAERQERRIRSMTAYEITEKLNELGDALRGEQRSLCYAAADKIEQLLHEINNLRLECGIDPA